MHFFIIVHNEEKRLNYLTISREEKVNVCRLENAFLIENKMGKQIFLPIRKTSLELKA